MQRLLKIIKIISLIIFLTGVIFGLEFFWQKKSKNAEIVVPKTEQVELIAESEVAIKNIEPEIKKESLPQEFLIQVPFSSQAPTGNWKKQLFQDGCEEASVVMAIAWTKNKKLTPAGVEKEIIGISNWEKRIFGYAVDASLVDVTRIVNEFYGYKNVKIISGENAQNIKEELAKKCVLLVPVDGKILANPHYTFPGPEQHMLVLKGFDDEQKQFIANDPGTKFGENYVYDYDKFVAAIWSYPSGKEHAKYPTNGKVEKNIISICK
ncbi:MAG: C39 family peptidase [bacterium]